MDDTWAPQPARVTLRPNTINLASPEICNATSPQHNHSRIQYWQPLSDESEEDELENPDFKRKSILLNAHTLTLQCNAMPASRTSRRHRCPTTVA